MQTIIQVVTAATETILATLYEAKVALRITGETNDELVELSLRQSSEEIALACCRVLAKETVVETFREIPNAPTTLYLSHYPIQEITNVTNDGNTVAESGYAVDAKAGKITILENAWGSTAAVSYTGGYDCPFDVPPPLRKAAILYTREAYFAAVRGDASVRMISHKEARIIYFDPNMALRAMAVGGAGAGGATPTQRAARALLSHFTRFAV